MIRTTLRIASVISSLALLICFVLYRAGTFDAVPESEKPIFSSSKYTVVAPSAGQPQPNSSAEPYSAPFLGITLTKDGTLQLDDLIMSGSKSGEVFMSGSKSGSMHSRSNSDVLMSGSKSGFIIDPKKKDLLPFDLPEPK